MSKRGMSKGGNEFFNCKFTDILKGKGRIKTILSR